MFTSILEKYIIWQRDTLIQLQKFPESKEMQLYFVTLLGDGDRRSGGWGDNGLRHNPLGDTVLDGALELVAQGPYHNGPRVATW